MMVDEPSGLPVRPSMGWLRKTAKQHLAELRVADPTARLASAQLAVARRHGFSSWRRLAAHVDAVSSDAARLTAAVSDGDLAVAGEILGRQRQLVDVAADVDEPERPSDSNAMTRSIGQLRAAGRRWYSYCSPTVRMLTGATPMAGWYCTTASNSATTTSPNCS